MLLYKKVLLMTFGTTLVHLIGSTCEYFCCRRYRLCVCVCVCISPYSDCPAIRIIITLSN